jgi:hypothetical protein
MRRVLHEGQTPRSLLFGYRLVEQRALGVTRVEKLGFEAHRPTIVQMRMRWAGDGGHGVVPAGDGHLTILCVYTKLHTPLLLPGRLTTPDLVAAFAHST